MKGDEKMRKFFAFSLVISLLLLGPAFSLSAAGKPPEKGGVLPMINLPVPKSPNEKSYLGLSGDGFFRIPKIKAKVVIIEIFSMYCPYCQKDAPKINEMYQVIQDNPDLKDKIKMIGIGAGNSSYEVSVFKKTYAVPFPLFPDKDFEIHKACGEVRTPYFIGVKINEDGTHQIIYTQLGDFQGAEPFLELILKASGLK
jgi:thiol-disulfide isomerase/thioredoxin